MNVLDSECSSGCESGWTLYLEQRSSHRKGNSHCEENYYEDKKYSAKANEHDDDVEEEEGLSMVSDASSGPPHFNEDEALGYYFNGVNAAATKMPNNNGGKRLKKKEQRCRENEKLPSALDDTASSPFINFSKNDFALTNNNQASMESVLDYSQAFSATHFQGRSAFQEHFGFLQPSLSGNHLQNNQWY